MLNASSVQFVANVSTTLSWSTSDICAGYSKSILAITTIAARIYPLAKIHRRLERLKRRNAATSLLFHCSADIIIDIRASRHRRDRIYGMDSRVA